MIELTKEQHDSLTQNGMDRMRVYDPEAGEEYVLVRAEVYERIKALLVEDEGGVDDYYRASMEAFAPGWNDPQMDAYDALDPRRKP